MCVMHLAIHPLASITSKSASAEATPLASAPGLLTVQGCAVSHWLSRNFYDSTLSPLPDLNEFVAKVPLLKIQESKFIARHGRSLQC